MPWDRAAGRDAGCHLTRWTDVVQTPGAGHPGTLSSRMLARTKPLEGGSGGGGGGGGRERGRASAAAASSSSSVLLLLLFIAESGHMTVARLWRELRRLRLQ